MISAIDPRIRQPADTIAALPSHVYVHVPFCRRRCSYCNFSIAVRRDVPASTYVDGLRRELELRYSAPERSTRASTIYLGGGTPSLLGPDGVARVMDVLRARAQIDEATEVTLEANPEDITLEAARAWHRAGINRASVGVQSFDPAVLAWMHRPHTAARATGAVETLRAAGFRNVSADLIFALPAAVPRDWRADLAATLALGVEHVSLYGLTVEPRTPLARWIDRGIATEAAEEVYESDYLAAHATLVGAGFEHYEVSNFARPGFRSRHNWSYWADAAYGGLGPAAHGFDGRVRRWNESRYTRWLELVQRGVDPVEGAEEITPENRLLERVYLELRTVGGTVLQGNRQDLASSWVTAGWGRIDGERLTLTPAGWLRLDTIAVQLANARSQ